LPDDVEFDRVEGTRGVDLHYAEEEPAEWEEEDYGHGDGDAVGDVRCGAEVWVTMQTRLVVVVISRAERGAESKGEEDWSVLDCSISYV
jgi:hypothetical protein